MSNHDIEVNLPAGPEQEIFKIARGLLEGEIEPIKGSRLLASYRSEVDFLEEELLVFTGIASQTDEFPENDEQRAQWAPEALARIDKEIEIFFSDQKLMNKTCSIILSKISEKYKLNS
jgi:hypothetical protein